MAGNNRTTVRNTDVARGFVQWLGGALVLAAIAWSQPSPSQWMVMESQWRNVQPPFVIPPA